MSIPEKRDILLHYDEDSEEIIFYTVDSDSIKNIRDKEFDGARSDIRWYQDKKPDKAEKELGAMIFSLLDSFSIKKIAIRDYEYLNKVAHREYVSELKVKSKKSDPEAIFSLFIEYHSRALQEKSLEYLKTSEKFLNSAAELGYQEAKDYLEKDWKLMKQAILNRINRK